MGMRKVEACPACGHTNVQSTATENAEVLARFYAFSKIKYGGLLDDWLDDIELVILRCLACGHHWYRDQPEATQLDAMYSAGKPLRGARVGLTRDPATAMIKEMVRMRSLIPRARPSLLDYGSGFGRWARAAVETGFTVCAFEPSEARGKEDNVLFSVVHDLAELHEQTFDVVNLEQVLEHVPEPEVILKNIQTYCHADTLVRITVPNILRSDEGEEIWREWPFDGRSAHFMAPFEHLHGFTPESLRQVVQRSGFVLLDTMRMARHWPLTTARWWLGRWIQRMDQTFLIVRPRRGSEK